MKKILSMLLLCTSITLMSCETINDSILVAKITLNKTELQMIQDGKETLIATVAPENATNKQVAWESSDASVATVSEIGEVTAVKEGTAVITATSVADNTKKATCTVLVGIFPSGVTLNMTNLLLTIGGKETLLATIAPENVTDKKVKWESSDANVATVSETGEVTALTKGTATITVTTVDVTKTASCVVTVVDETNAKCQVVNNVTPVTSIIGANGTMYEANVLFYGDPNEIGVASIGDVSPAGGQSSTIPSLAGAIRVRVSFRLLPSTNTSPINPKQYTMDYFVLKADELTTITITDNTILTTTKGLMRGVSETMTFREALNRL